ncbi:alpha/beta hydrolase [Enterococcus olivae]
MTKLLTLSTGLTVSVMEAETEAKKYMLYFHGGGFVYGSKNDLPQALAQVFLEVGYTILAVDYPLAPNHSLQEILDTNLRTFQELYENVIQDTPFSFCGRSAGGFAILSLTQQLLEKKGPLPEKLISFYGYYDLKFLSTRRNVSNRVITEEMIQTIDQTQPVYDDPLLQRSLLYLYGVQQQKLADYYQLDKDNSERFAIDPTILKQFPPTFSTASTTDTEIPFKYSKSLKRMIPNSKFVPVYDLAHDFLKQPEHEQVQKVLHQLQRWLIDEH